MYALAPKAVYAHKRVFDNPRAVERMERMLDAIGVRLEDVARVDLDDLDEICEVAGVSEDMATEELVAAGHGRVRQGHLKLAHDPVLVFNTFVWDEADRLPRPREFRNTHSRRLQNFFCGVGEDFAFSEREVLSPGKNYVCQGGWGIHTLGGCFHKCDYCNQGFIVTVMLDIDEFCEHLPNMFRRRPQQKLYRYDLFSDILAFEPEYGASETIAKTFAEHDKYLLLYTRSDNVGWLADFPEREYVLANWTLSMETQCRTIERDSPTLDERIEAMRFCQEHGYVVRAGFSPVIPVADWRAETTDMLERLFARVRPEVLRAWVLSMMDASEFETMFDTSAMDRKFMARMREEAENLNGLKIAPFPLDARAEIYEHYLSETRRISNGQTPLAICTEHPKIWEMIGDRVDMEPNDMFCCCGALSAPGRWDKRLEKTAF